ncbi:MAG: nucleotidyltransferase [Sedimentisphaerales bacterium]
MLNRLKDVFKSFQKHDLHYVVIGGVASVLYGVPRATFDMDILIEPTVENAQKLLAALEEAGFGTATITNAQDIIAHEITIFNDRIRIDVQTRTPGVSFKDAWLHRKTMTYQGQDFFILSKEDLINTKRAAGREIDLKDVNLLEETDSDEKS